MAFAFLVDVIQMKTDKKDWGLIGRINAFKCSLGLKKNGNNAFTCNSSLI
jgi:hypothetical protein